MQAGYELRAESWDAPRLLAPAELVARAGDGLVNVCMTYNPSLAPRAPGSGLGLGDAAERLPSGKREAPERPPALASHAALRVAGSAERRRGSMKSIAGAQGSSGMLSSLGRE